MIGHPPRSPLFPARRSSDLRSPSMTPLTASRPPAAAAAVERRRYLFALVDGGGTVPPELGLVRRLVADRKSTRLNSSHANISYAVFCLKQKSHLTLFPTHYL